MSIINSDYSATDPSDRKLATMRNWSALLIIGALALGFALHATPVLWRVVHASLTQL